MSRFPEEPLDLPEFEGGGYLPIEIGQMLNGGRYEVVRKLGYGRRSSVWLVRTPVKEPPYYEAVKVYTLSSSAHADSVEHRILQHAGRYGKLPLPYYSTRFLEKVNNGSHLCVVTGMMSASLLDISKEVENGRFPVEAVQRMAYLAVNGLYDLHGSGVMHGGGYFNGEFPNDL